MLLLTSKEVVGFSIRDWEIKSLIIKHAEKDLVLWGTWATPAAGSWESLVGRVYPATPVCWAAQGAPCPELSFPGYDLDEVKLKIFLTSHCLCLDCEVGWGEIKDISNKVKYCYQGPVYGLNRTWKGAVALELVAWLFFFWAGLQKQKLSQTGVGDNLVLSENLD